MKFSIAIVMVVCAFAGLTSASSLSDRLSARLSSLGLKDRLSGLEDRLNGVVERITDFNKSIQDLVLSRFNDNQLVKAKQWFEPELGELKLDLTNRSANFLDVVRGYYSVFKNKTLDGSRLLNLVNSVKDIIERCADPSKNDTAKYGLTELSDKSPEEVRALFGVRAPTQLENNTRRKRLSGSDSACQVSASLPASFDWRSKGVVTSVKNQGSCGSCWTFASTAAIESALVKAGRASNTLDLSEQQLVNCASSNGCNGGYSQQAFQYVKSNGQASESSAPYAARSGSCQSYARTATIRDFCVRSKYRYTSASLAENLSDDTIQKALVQNGPLYITVDANPLQNYRSGVLNTGSCTTNINHAVTLVGYSGPNNSWIVKNSWGTGWGQQGYFEVVRGRNMCGINTEIAWPLL